MVVKPMRNYLLNNLLKKHFSRKKSDFQKLFQELNIGNGGHGIKLNEEVLSVVLVKLAATCFKSYSPGNIKEVAFMCLVFDGSMVL